MGETARRNSRLRPERRVVRGVVLAAVLPLLVVGVASAAHAEPAPSGPSGQELSPRLLQLSELPFPSGPAGTADEVAAAAGDLGVAESGPGSLQVDAVGQVSVTVRYTTGPSEADVAALAALGTVHASSSRFGLASASVAPGDLAAVAALPNVQGVEEALAPVVGGSSALGAAPAPATVTASAAAAAGPAALAASCRTVPANLAEPLNAAVAAHDFGVDGTGVTVGVISDSFERDPKSLTTPAEDVAAGLLPGPGNPCGFDQPVEVVTEATGAGTDEGRAMAQLVHGIAPGARILFASSGQDELTFATAITDLAAAGADVIVDDITMFSDPFFQDGPIGVSISDVGRDGVAYLSAAGNFTLLGASGHPSAGLPISSWATEAYRPTTCPPAVLTALADEGIDSADCLDFDPGAGADPVDDMVFKATPEGAAATFSLHWAEPVGAAAGTFHFGLIKPDGTAEITPPNASGIPSVTGSTPTEAGDYGFVIVRNTMAGPSSEVTPPLKVLLAADPYLQAVEYYSSTGGDVVGPTITGHAGAPQTIAVAAAPYDSPREVESFSSAGPTTKYFDYDPAVSPIATPLATPLVTSKPDVTGVDGGFTNFFSADQQVSPGIYAFYGTSAASPAVAAVVALGRELRPDASLESVRTALDTSAVPLKSPLPAVFEPAEIVGSGLVDASGFLAALPVPAPAPEPVPEPAAVPGSQLAATGVAASPLGLVSPLGLALALGLVAAGAATTVVARRRAARR